jgi:hypothetical protein
VHSNLTSLGIRLTRDTRPNHFYPVAGTFFTVYPLVYSPGYLVKERIAQVETNFYSTTKPDGELVWTGTTNAFNVKSPMKVINELVKIVIKELEKQKVIVD